MPTLVEQIHEHNLKGKEVVNLKGFAVGNGIIGAPAVFGFPLEMFVCDAERLLFSV